jgi:hypothetical protein
VNIAGGLSQINIINNYYKPGPAAPADLKFVHANFQKENAKGTGQWYLNGNIMEGDNSLTKKNFRGLDLAEGGYQKGADANEPFAVSSPLPEQSAKDAYENVLKYAGAIFPKRDGVDERVVNETRTGTAIGKGVFGRPGIIDMPVAVGGWSQYKTVAPPLDTDEDGMPDEWEKKNGLNPNDANDRNKIDKNGYTMLENYLNELAVVK